MAATRPTISWPGTIGSFGSGNSPSTTCRSVRQTPQAVISTRISPASGAGNWPLAQQQRRARAFQHHGPHACHGGLDLVGADTRVPQDLAVALGLGPDHGVEFIR